MPSLPFQVKVCGVMRLEDLDVLAAAGVDAVGLNLVSISRRCITLEHAIELSLAAKERSICTVAVLMNDTDSKINQVEKTGVFDYLQLHGTESPERLSSLQLRPGSIIKSISWSGRTEEVQLAEQWRQSPLLASFLIDAYAPGVGGGSGKTASWDLYPRPACFGDKPIILAGGLRPENVVAAIQATHCDAVDTASGVEISAGLKGRELVFAFATNAKSAMA